MNPIPSIPMLSGSGSGKVFLVIGVLLALAAISSASKTPPTNNTQR
jgi:hypothetical protein